LGPGNYLRLSICDTGTGMEPETLKRIFEPFFTTRAEGAGSGLGLYVVKNIVDKLNGRVVVNSSAGKGTTVDVYVPLAKSTTRQKNVPNIAEHPQRSQGERILYVDDDEAMVELLTRSLKRLGYDVTGSSNPVSSLTIFQTDPMRFDAVVSGLSMPHMSGIDLAREIRKVRPDIPLLITTGYIRPDDAAAARNLGLPDLILKPNAVEDLANLIASLLKNKGKKEDHPLPTGKGASGS